MGARVLLFFGILFLGFVLQDLVPHRPIVPVVEPPLPRGLYDGYATPARILRAHARVESDEKDWAIGDDGKSRGRMQLNEDFHEARARAWGDYDPHNVFDALRVADRVWQENGRYFAERAPRGDPDTWAERREDLTIGAYQRGRVGVVRMGPMWEYVGKVRKEMGQ